MLTARAPWRRVGRAQRSRPGLVNPNPVPDSNTRTEPMLKSLVVIVVALFLSLRYTDLDSASALRSVWLPVLDFLLILALAVWGALWLGGRRGGAGDSGGYSLGGGDGGGDCSGGGN